MATPMEVDATTGQAPVASAGLGPNTMTNSGRSQRSPVIKCIYGCAINPSEEAIPLFCMHFICSDACAAKLKAQLTPGKQLMCPLCELFIMPGELDRKIVPDSIFAKRSENGDLNLRLNEHTQQQIEEFSPSQPKDKCGQHGLLLTIYCENCDSKICPECNPTHSEHATFDVLTETETLKAKINLARNLRSVSESAIVDLQMKREQLLKAQWNYITTAITEQFEKLVQALLRSEEELLAQTRKMLMRQLTEQNRKITSAKHAKCISTRFIANAESVLQNGADISCIQFLREYEKLIQWLGNVDNQISQNYDDFVQKGQHFKLCKKVSTKGALQKLLSEYCCVKLLDKNQPTNNPSTPTNALTTSAQAQATPGPSTSTSSLGSELGGSIGTQRPRRVPMKSTPPSQFSRNVVQTYAPFHVRLAKHKASLLQPAANTVNVQVIEISSDEEDDLTSTTVNNEVELVSTQAEAGSSGEIRLDERGIPDVQVASNFARLGQISNNGADLEKLVMDTDVTMEDDGSGEEEVEANRTPNASITNVVNDAPRNKVVADPPMSTVAASPPVSNVVENVPATMGTVASGPSLSTVFSGPSTNTGAINPSPTIESTMPAGLHAEKRQRMDKSLEQPITEKSSPRTALRRSNQSPISNQTPIASPSRSRYKKCKLQDQFSGSSGSMGNR